MIWSCQLVLRVLGGYKQDHREQRWWSVEAGGKVEDKGNTSIELTNYDIQTSWFCTITLISPPARTASNASLDFDNGKTLVMSCLRSTTPRERRSMAEGKHEAVYRVTPRTSISLFVTARVGNVLVWICPKPTARSTSQLQADEVGQNVTHKPHPVSQLLYREAHSPQRRSLQ